MNSRQRVLAALAGQPIDRRAFIPLLSLYGGRLTGCDLERYYSDPVAYAAGQATVCVAFSPDVVFAPFAFALIGAAFGSDLRFFADQPPNVCRPAISSAEQAGSLAWPDISTDARLRFLIGAVRLLVEDSHGEVPVAVPLPGLADLPPLFMGMDAWMEAILFDPDKAQAIVTLTSRLVVQLANQAFAAGASFIAVPCAFASQAVLPRHLVASFALPALDAALAQFRGPVVLHHAGETAPANLDLLACLPNVVALLVAQRDDLDAARRVIGPDVVLLGGLNGPELDSLKEADVRRQCQAILRNRIGDRRFILCTCGPDVPFATPPENIRAMRNAVDAAGRIQE